MRPLWIAVALVALNLVALAQDKAPSVVPTHMENALKSLKLDDATYQQAFAVLESHRQRIQAIQKEMDAALEKMIGAELFKKYNEALRPKATPMDVPMPPKPTPPVGSEGNPGFIDPRTGKAAELPMARPQKPVERPDDAKIQAMRADLEKHRIEMALHRLQLNDKQKKPVEANLAKMAELSLKSVAERENLRKAVDAGKDDEILLLINKIRETDTQVKAETTKLQAELRQLLNAKQQAILIELNFLD